MASMHASAGDIITLEHPAGICAMSRYHTDIAKLEVYIVDIVFNY